MRKRFTLVELMIVVAIVMVLAAIAMPNFYTMQLRAKRAELAPNVDGITTALIAYTTTHDVWLSSPTPVPDATPGKAARDWASLGEGLDDLDWTPDGQVRGSYAFNAGTVGCPVLLGPMTFAGCGATGACVAGVANVDGSGALGSCAQSEISDDLETLSGTRLVSGPDTY